MNVRGEYGGGVVVDYAQLESTPIIHTASHLPLQEETREENHVSLVSTSSSTFPSPIRQVMPFWNEDSNSTAHCRLLCRCNLLEPFHVCCIV